MAENNSISVGFRSEEFACLKHAPRHQSSEWPTPVECVSVRPQESDQEARLRLLHRIRRIIQSYETNLEEKDHIIQSLQMEKQQFSQQQLQSSHQIETLQQENSNLQQEIQTLQQIREKDQIEAQENYTELHREIVGLSQQLEQGKQELGTMNHRTDMLVHQAEYQKLRHIQQIRGLQEIILSQKRVINESSAHVSQKNETIARKNELIAAKEKEIYGLRQ